MRVPFFASAIIAATTQAVDLEAHELQGGLPTELFEGELSSSDDIFKFLDYMDFNQERDLDQDLDEDDDDLALSDEENADTNTKLDEDGNVIDNNLEKDTAEVAKAAGAPAPAGKVINLNAAANELKDVADKGTQEIAK